jgi:hypothetical protein
MRWAGHVARMGKDRKVYRVLVGNPKERDHSEDRGVDGRMWSEWILGRLTGGVEWIQLAQDRDQLRADVNAIMNLLLLAPRL